MQEYTLRSTKTKKSSLLRRLADIAVIFAVCFALLLLIFKVLLVPFRVADARVSDVAEGDILLVDRFSRYLSDYSVGDLLRAETSAGAAVYRMAAKGGSNYTVKDGAAYIDGVLIDESAYSDGWAEDVNLSIDVPEDEILLLPDDREGVKTLSEWSVLYNSVYGEVRFRVSPLSRLAVFV